MHTLGKWLALCAIALWQAPICAQDLNFGRDFQRILPRGAIAAITHPAYVPANQARIGKNTWVLGLVIDGQAYAYSLNLLNHHEVVNDRLGGIPLAAVW